MRVVVNHAAPYMYKLLGILVLNSALITRSNGTPRLMFTLHGYLIRCEDMCRVEPSALAICVCCFCALFLDSTMNSQDPYLCFFFLFWVHGSLIRPFPFLNVMVSMPASHVAASHSFKASSKVTAGNQVPAPSLLSSPCCTSPS